MTIVVDLGASDREGRWPSLTVLADRFKPDMLYGFDPSPSLNYRQRRINGIPCQLRRSAAWTYDGLIRFDDNHVHARNGTIGVGPHYESNVTAPGRMGMIGEGTRFVTCFDFSAWLANHGPAICKLDVEGSEYGILEKCIHDGTYKMIEHLLIEWHFHVDQDIVDALEGVGCEVETWIY